jgi:hypothetical protein
LRGSRLNGSQERENCLEFSLSDAADVEQILETTKSPDLLPMGDNFFG